MFGYDVKIELSTSILLLKTIHNISEEDLENVMQNVGANREKRNSANAKQVNNKNSEEYIK